MSKQSVEKKKVPVLNSLQLQKLLWEKEKSSLWSKVCDMVIHGIGTWHSYFRSRSNQGDMFKGRALTVGGVVFHYSQTAFKYHHFIRLRTSQQQHKLCID